MSESYGGITVPDGHPAEIAGVAGSYSALADSMGGVQSELTALPGTLTSWSGPASVAFAGVSVLASSAARVAQGEFAAAAGAALRDSQALEHAQKDARGAIRDLEDADRRVHKAEIALADARHRVSEALRQIASAQTALSHPGGVVAGAHAELARAQHALGEAERDERRARHELAHAQQDARDARKRGVRAEHAADREARALAAAMSAVQGAVPALPTLGTPASGVFGTGWLPPLTPPPLPGGGAPVRSRRPPGSFLLDPAFLINEAGAGTLGYATGRGRQLVYSRRFLYRETARLGNPLYDPIRLRPEQQVPTRAARSVLQSRISDVEREAGRLKVLRGAGRALGPLGAVIQAKENTDKGMNPVENTFRTGFSWLFGAGGATLGGTACAELGPAAAACAMAGGAGGSEVGNRFGGVMYHGADYAYHHAAQIAVQAIPVVGPIAEGLGLP